MWVAYDPGNEKGKRGWVLHDAPFNYGRGTMRGPYRFRLVAWLVMMFL